MIAVYAGTFDPITNGHFEMARRASTIFETVIVGIAHTSEKKTIFSSEERLEMTKEVLNAFSNIEIKEYSGLTIDFAKSENANVLIRGLRSPFDAQFEFELASMNKRLAEDIETVFISSSGSLAFISSSLIKQIASEGGDISEFVHPTVQRALQEKFQD
jgi:pantetheine-phosphate adenylyltransferase